MFEKYEYESFVAAFKCELSVGTSMKPESGDTMVDDANIMLTSLIIICNYTIYSFRKRSIYLKKQCII